jgi:hypothetical protein
MMKGFRMLFAEVGEKAKEIHTGTKEKKFFFRSNSGDED